VATPRLVRNDLAGHIRVLKSGWRPAGRTLVLAVTDDSRTTLTAVPIDPGEPVPIVELTDSSGWQLRPDGGALAVAFVNGSYETSRIATIDLASGVARWVTPDEPDILDATPVWSNDGSAIYFTEHVTAPATYGDRGIFRIVADGSGRTQVHGPDRNGGGLVRVAPGGRWLIWTRGQAGGSTDVLDLVTGVNRTFNIAGSSGEMAWREARPRALVMSHGCCAGLPIGELLLWDDVTGATTELIGPDAAPLVFAGSADWNPSGTRIAASVSDRAALERSPRTVTRSIAIFDASGAYRAFVPDVVGDVVAWLPEGILVRQYVRDVGFELTLVTESGDRSRSIYRTSTLNVRFDEIVSP
jgi:hypothetical protein